MQKGLSGSCWYCRLFPHKLFYFPDRLQTLSAFLRNLMHHIPAAAEFPWDKPLCLAVQLRLEIVLD